MMQNFFPHANLEKLNPANFGLKAYDFNLALDAVIYFETSFNPELNEYIDDNFEVLKHNFKKVDKNFIYLPRATFPDINIKSILEFYIPHLPKDKLKIINDKYLKSNFSQAIYSLNGCVAKEEGVENLYLKTEIYQSFLEHLNYTGNIKSGFLFYESGFCILESPKSEIQFADFFYDFFDSIHELRKLDEDYDDFPLSYDDLYESLDEEARAKIEEMKANLNSLKNSGKFILMLPILKTILDEYADEINLSSISTIVIDNNCKIHLPYFNKEIVLSHFTKSVYFLFLNHPEGIYISELSNYKKELLSIYRCLSNQWDYHKIVATVDDLVNPESKAIYTHISRIKSALFKIMDAKYARNYIIQGKADEIRKINFDRNNIHWDGFFLWD